MGVPAKGLLPHPHPAPSHGLMLAWTHAADGGHMWPAPWEERCEHGIVSERLGPHPGLREMRSEGLCGVQCATWGRRKAAQARPPLGHCRGQNQARSSHAKESEPAAGTAQAVAF